MSVNMKLKATSKITMTWFYLVIIMILQTSSAKDTIFPNQTLKDGNTIISPGEFFELGFFSTGNSSLRYLGIWYRSISRGTVVWVANRQVPLADPTGELKLNETGSLHLLTANNNLIWSSSRSSNVTNLVARLLDSGNFVVRDDISGELVWQSFDHPGDTFMPGMKLGVSLETGVMWNLTSWKTSDDPSAGSYTVFMDTNGYPQLYNKRFESDFQQRLGFWNGRGFTGVLGFKQNNIYTFEFVWNEVEIYFMYHLVNTSVSRMTLSNNGTLERLVWIERTNSWVTFMSVAKDKCDEYGLCGWYGSCTIQNSPACACLEGFEPKLPEEWSVADWSNGCKLDVSINYENNFKRFTNLKLPDTRDAWFNTSLSLDECENLCRRNISCTAYANTDIRLGGSGCLMWFKELIDIRDAGQGDVSGQDIYIKMVNPYSNREEKKNKSHLKVTLSIALPVVLVLVGFRLIFYARRNKKQKSHHKDETLKQDSNLPFFSLKEVVKATDNFSMNNKLGQGGFGAVYKGVLENGGEIAVKRLSKTSKQGVVEFQNEVICIAKLQHRNLVKLLGCCVQGEEMMLIYEYLPNKSLDYFLFDESSSLLRDWPQRYHIINGIARGIVYLHQDSRLRIIHRDLKASNILLDSNMNPKISDFGLARMFKEYETEANTGKVAGTLGYMSPEYVGFFQ